MRVFWIALASLSLSSLSSVGQTMGHVEVDQVKASYKSQPSASSPSNVTMGPNIQVKATLSIQLRDSSDAAKIYVKMIDRQSGLTVYQVSYLLNSADVVDNGLQLFSRQGNTILVTNPSTVALKPYSYEIYTEDASGIAGPVYTILQ